MLSWSLLARNYAHSAVFQFDSVLIWSPLVGYSAESHHDDPELELAKSAPQLQGRASAAVATFLSQQLELTRAATQMVEREENLLEATKFNLGLKKR